MPLIIEAIERKSAMLSRSSLACLKSLPTMNLTVGCAHGCVYCYTQGYSIYPGASRVQYYHNAYERLADELPRKRKRPTAVYFSPSSDLFQPVPEVLEMGRKIIRLLFENDIGVAFLTKGQIPDEHMQLLLTRPELVRAQIGLITLDDYILKAFEPNAPSAAIRLKQAKELVQGGIATQIRLDPMLPGLTDGEKELNKLCKAIADAGVTRIAASVLFTRPRLAGILRRTLKDSDLLQKLLANYTQTTQIGIHAENSTVHAMPVKKRQAIYDRLQRIATPHGLTVHLCGCKNPDLTSETCHISGVWENKDTSKQQKTLFPLD